MHMVNRNNRDEYSREETAQRRDEVIRRMANTPPQPKATPLRPKKKKKAGAVRAARKSRARRED
jgi:hypothetical protein